MKTLRIGAVLFLAVFLASCAGGPLTKREGGGILGGLLGATAGGIVGHQSGHAGVGAVIGGALGLGAGALIGDQLQGQEQNQFNPEDLVGLTEQEALRKLEAAGFTVRITRRDNQKFIGTTDYRRDRVKLEIDNGIVTKAYIG